MAQNRKISIDAYHSLRDKYDMALQKHAWYEHELHRLRSHAMVREHEMLNKICRIRLWNRIKFVFNKESINEHL